MTAETDKTKHFNWLIESRHRNQTCSLQLRLLLREYEKKWKTKKYSVAAQELVSVSFSLWRAVFLAEKTGNRAAVFDDGLKFLERVIEDNSIAYAQDKQMREWSFNYYTKAARFSLEYLHRLWPDISPEYAKQTRSPKERWTYCQECLESSILQFRTLFEATKKVVASKAKPAKARPKSQTNANRAIVRQMQIEAKKKPKGV